MGGLAVSCRGDSDEFFKVSGTALFESMVVRFLI